LNNNIGGLDRVDEGLGLSPLVPDDKDKIVGLGRALTLTIVVPIVFVVVVVVVVLGGCFVMKRLYARRVMEYGETYEFSEDSENQEDDDALIPPTPTPLNRQRAAERGRGGEDEDTDDDSTGEDS